MTTFTIFATKITLCTASTAALFKSIPIKLSFVVVTAAIAALLHTTIIILSKIHDDSAATAASSQTIIIPLLFLSIIN